MAFPAGQTWNSDTYAVNARFVAELGMPVVELLSPRRGETILDLGCGDGDLTERIACMGMHVIGLDASRELVKVARSRDLEIHEDDAHDFDLGRTFDAVFSNAALHWMREPAKVLRCVARHLKPGGRFVGEMGGKGNTMTVSAAIRLALARRGLDFDDLSPWYFPCVEQYRRELIQAGFEIRSIELIPRLTVLPGDLTAWLETFAGTFTNHLEPTDRRRFLAEVCEACAPTLLNPDGRWTVDYVRLRFAAACASRAIDATPAEPMVRES